MEAPRSLPSNGEYRTAPFNSGCQRLMGTGSAAASDAGGSRRGGGGSGARKKEKDKGVQHVLPIVKTPKVVKVGAVFKCGKCSALSSKKKWFETQSVVVKARGDEVVEQPVGDKCDDCGDVHQKGFPHLSWPEFCELETADPAQNKEIDTVKGVMKGEKKSFEDVERVFPLST